MSVHRLMVAVPLPIARVQERSMAAVLSSPPLTPATLELFAFDNVTDLHAVDRPLGLHSRAFRNHIREHDICA